MDRALWLLLALRLRGWLRRLRRGLGSVRGILLCLFGLLVSGCWVLPAVFLAPPQEPHLEQTRRLGPLVLVAFCVLNVLFSSGERAITFTPAEVNLLFPAPFSRRQLLLYKIAGTLGAAVFASGFLALVMRQHTALYLAAFVGLTLTLVFWQLFSMALSLAASVTGARAFNRRRKLVLAALAVVLVVAAVRAGAEARQEGWLQILQDFEEGPVMRVLLAPVGWLVQASTAERLWPDLVQWAGLALLLDLALLGLVLLLDAQYLEASAVASEKLYARLQQVRRGGPAAGRPPSGKVRLGLPMLPFWGGVGPLLWRQLTTALRSLWSLVLLLLLFGMMVAPVLLEQDGHGSEEAGTGTAAAMLVGMSLFVPPLLPFDFRGDVDRMDLLKALPVPAWRLVLGQLLTPVLLVSAVQVVLLAVAQVLRGRAEPLLLAVAAFLPAVNLLLFEMENLFFLWFPARLTALMAPGDFQMLGRHMLLWVAKFFLLGLVLGAAAVAGGVTYLLSGESVLAGELVGWVVVTAAALALVPLLALAFRGFDVARDVPA